MHSEIIIFLMNYQQQLKGLHWQTKSYARHKAYGKMYDKLNNFIDTFAEISMGKYGRIEFKNTSLAIYDIESPELSDYLSGIVEYLNSISDKLDETDTDLLNLRDEILAETNKLKYLLTLS
jgi:DNA-binding ferritin-like protein